MNHQPYLYAAPAGETLLFCQASGPASIQFAGAAVDVVPWKIAARRAATSWPVNTPAQINGFPVVSECTPCVYFAAGSARLSYVAGLNKGPLRPLVYHHVTAEFDHKTATVGAILSVSVEPTFSACVTDSGEILTTSKDRQSVVSSVSGPLEILEGFDHVARVVNVYAAPHLLILTIKAGADYRSILKDLDSGAESPLRNQAGEEIYKCTLLGDRLAYAVRVGPDFEDREIVTESIL